MFRRQFRAGVSYRLKGGFRRTDAQPARARAQTVITAAYQACSRRYPVKPVFGGVDVCYCLEVLAFGIAAQPQTETLGCIGCSCAHFKSQHLGACAEAYQR